MKIIRRIAILQFVQSKNKDNQPAPCREKHPHNIYFLKLFCIIGFACFFLLLSLSFHLRRNLWSLPKEIFDNFYFSYFSTNALGSIGNFYIVKLIYLLLFLSIIFSIIIPPFLNKIKIPAKPFFFNRTITDIFLIVFLIVTGTQTAQHFMLLRSSQKAVHNKSLAETNFILHGPEYTFALFCKNILPEKHSGIFISEHSVKNDQATMTAQRRIAYFLYPTVDIRVNNKKDIGCIIVYNKKNPEQAVPEGFKIAGYFEENSLIATKKLKK